MLCGTGKRSRRDLTSIIQVDLVYEETVLARKINEALKYCARVPTEVKSQLMSPNYLLLGNLEKCAHHVQAVQMTLPTGCLLLMSSEAPNDDFLLNILKVFFRLSRVLLDIYKCIISRAIKFVSFRSS